MSKEEAGRKLGGEKQRKVGAVAGKESRDDVQVYIGASRSAKRIEGRRETAKSLAAPAARQCADPRPRERSGDDGFGRRIWRAAKVARPSVDRSSVNHCYPRQAPFAPRSRRGKVLRCPMPILGKTVHASGPCGGRERSISPTFAGFRRGTGRGVSNPLGNIETHTGCEFFSCSYGCPTVECEPRTPGKSWRLVRSIVNSLPWQIRQSCGFK